MKMKRSILAMAMLTSSQAHAGYYEVPGNDTSDGVTRPNAFSLYPSGTHTRLTITNNAQVFAVGSCGIQCPLEDDGEINYTWSTFVDTTVENGGQMFVNSIAKGSTINSGGLQVVSGVPIFVSHNPPGIPGITYASTVNSGGVQILEDGGRSEGTTINAGGRQFVESGSRSQGTIINSGGFSDVRYGGQAFDSTVNDGGYQIVANDAQSWGTIINAGGIEYVQGGSTSHGASAGAGGMQWVYTGGMTEATVVAADGLLRVEDQGSVASDSVVEAGGTLEARRAGQTLNTFVDGIDALEVVSTNASATGTTLQNGGLQHVKAGGLANSSVVLAGGMLDVSEDGTVVDATVMSGGQARFDNGAFAAGSTTVSGDGRVTMLAGAQVEALRLQDANSTLTAEIGSDPQHRLFALDSLHNDGRVQFNNAIDTNGYGTLEVRSLTGSGTFAMRVAGMDGDFLSVTDRVEGNFSVQVQDSGHDLQGAASDGYHLIHAAGSSADSFALVNGAVDLGAYKYHLVQEGGDDWVLSVMSAEVVPEPEPEVTPEPAPEVTPEPEPETTPEPEPEIPTEPEMLPEPQPEPVPTPKPELSNSAKAVVSMANALPSVWDAELSTLKTRMGELRGADARDGVWGKYVSSRYDVDNATVNYRQRMDGVVVGGDRVIESGDARWHLGVLGSYTQSDLDHASSGGGSIDSYSAGAYATYLNPQGYYVDAVLKAYRFKGENDVRSQDGSAVFGDLRTSGRALSVELGRRIEKGTWFVEPYAMLSTFEAAGTTYSLSNGLKARQGSAASLQGEVGATYGRRIALKNDMQISPYLRLAVGHEFEDDNIVTINDGAVFTNNMSGTKARVGAGMTARLSGKLDAFAEVTYVNGKQVEVPYNANVGVRLRF
ncbi:autotransporter outer membrane beta-barrel domain-containing protein [uncultured Stenotrophomonas sp.]|uniref:autotransporter outer membrane beta-barrel domain-containing protein n=1 Tax=uncultured Stenotrophomonas sp. TaxID=165438 RepID=UPI0028E64102|nr:autotransporter outer membrane beta-barrel domain-containing protein [uncultured Stenotrophomonas sp.]